MKELDELCFDVWDIHEHSGTFVENNFKCTHNNYIFDVVLTCTKIKSGISTDHYKLKPHQKVFIPLDYLILTKTHSYETTHLVIVEDIYYQLKAYITATPPDCKE